MISSVKINEISQIYDQWDVEVKFRIKNKLVTFNSQSIEDIFSQNYGLIQTQLHEKSDFVCYLELRKMHNQSVVDFGSLSFNWDSITNELYLGILWIEPEYRGNGFASYLLSRFVEFADDFGMNINLLSLPLGDPQEKSKEEDINETKRFYRKFGFEENEGCYGSWKNCSMTRKPQLESF